MLNKIILKCHKVKKKNETSMNHSQYYMYLQNRLDEISFHGDFNKWYECRCNKDVDVTLFSNILLCVCV